MLCDEPLIRDDLKRIVRSVTSTVAWHDDLLQEALIHLWLKETQFPGQTTSWYLQTCRCHVCDYLRRGVSVDSPKRSPDRCELTDESIDTEQIPECLILEGEAISLTCSRDLLEQLALHLDAINRNIVLLLVEGYNERETAERVGLSQPAVRKRRLKIARLSVALGFVPADRSISIAV